MKKSELLKKIKELENRIIILEAREAVRSVPYYPTYPYYPDWPDYQPWSQPYTTSDHTTWNPDWNRIYI